jgi:hypothetical protein
VVCFGVVDNEKLLWEMLGRSVERRTSLSGESTVFILLTSPDSNAANQQNKTRATLTHTLN